ncbi:hypothetical protein P691DRAFT_789326 [Macrolepiota fuliginosa MF-IS2]|uniref:Uncharacterized protein n=1 Tax=Macrolepiota fuliginosa MF-IS2 TaxID=1400762 RepID=A0A9P6BYD0_9AGAR|nr:hypothetical protein P691DRAFT_789326 [Macrolepiota fuliginosa MF-IS2]
MLYIREPWLAQEIMLPLLSGLITKPLKEASFPLVKEKGMKPPPAKDGYTTSADPSTIPSLIKHGSPPVKATQQLIKCLPFMKLAQRSKSKQTMPRTLLHQETAHVIGCSGEPGEAEEAVIATCIAAELDTYTDIRLRQLSMGRPQWLVKHNGYL